MQTRQSLNTIYVTRVLLRINLLFMICLLLGYIRLVCSVNTDAKLLQYTWKITSSSAPYLSDLDQEANKIDHIKSFLKTATRLSIIETDESHQDGTPIDLASIIAGNKDKITTLTLIGNSTIPSSVFSDISTLKNLAFLTIKQTAGTKLVLSGLPTLLNNCKKLQTVYLELPQASLPLQTEPLTLTLPALTEIYLQCSTITQSLLFVDCTALRNISAHVPNCPLVDVFTVQSNLRLPPIQMKIIESKQASLPFILSYNPAVYIDLYQNTSDGITLPEYTTATSTTISLGADVLMNKIIAENINRNHTPLLCCTQTPFSSWVSYQKHQKWTHSNGSYRLGTMATSLIGTSLSFDLFPDNIKGSYTYLLKKTEGQEIIDFLGKVQIKGIYLHLGRFNFKLEEEKADVPATIEEWLPMLAKISSIHFANCDVPTPIPKCFYKLYTLNSITIEKGNHPNLFEILAAMPGIKEINVDDCTFEHANTYILNKYINYNSIYNPSKTIKFINCRSEVDIKFLHHAVGFICFVVIIILSMLYIATIIGKKHLHLKASKPTYLYNSSLVSNMTKDTSVPAL
ncbi:hypothetical protein NEOKW01_0373 [Nematocida sp. AWRm80]|nr:hypothetical protein NEOKW01_0373 [Nematocida sp. AWRm80]